MVLAVTPKRCHSDVMDLTHYLDDLQRQLAAVAAADTNGHITGWVR